MCWLGPCIMVLPVYMNFLVFSVSAVTSGVCLHVPTFFPLILIWKFQLWEEKRTVLIMLYSKFSCFRVLWIPSSKPPLLFFTCITLRRYRKRRRSVSLMRTNQRFLICCLKYAVRAMSCIPSWEYPFWLQIAWCVDWLVWRGWLDHHNQEVIMLK